jgi:hypothetical protein
MPQIECVFEDAETMRKLAQLRHADPVIEAAARCWILLSGMTENQFEAAIFWIREQRVHAIDGGRPPDPPVNFNAIN